MIIVFVSNYINHYTLPLIEELNAIEGCKAYFVETDVLPLSMQKGGFREYDNRDFFIRYWADDSSKRKAEKLALSADVMVVGSRCMRLKYQRLRQYKLTFDMSERPLKKGMLNLLSPMILKNHICYHLFFRNKPLFMLCTSAYTAIDEYKLHAYNGRCYKMGYTPRINELDVPKAIESKRGGKTRIFWCARFIKWKHPEFAIELAERLVANHYDFELNMVGSGEELDHIQAMINERNLFDYVHLLGNYPNDEVLELMTQHHIFLFTSDKNEGWGVVLNEAMGKACCPVVSHLIGSVPFLIKHKENGMVFESGNIDSLTDSVRYLLDNPNEMERMSARAYTDISESWSPQVVACRLYRLFDEFLKGNYSFSFEEGPLSVASVISEKYHDL